LTKRDAKVLKQDDCNSLEKRKSLKRRPWLNREAKVCNKTIATQKMRSENPSKDDRNSTE